MITDLLRRGRTAIELADVTIAAPSRSFDFTFTRRHRILRWTWIQTVRRRFVVTALPLRELLAMNQHLGRLDREMGGLNTPEICAIILGTRDALLFTSAQAIAVWDWYAEANELPRPKETPAAPPAPPAMSRSPSSTSSTTSDAGPSTSTTDGSST